ncbi:uncharacterized protein OCT59_025572 [Rhizophagus irregularis]|uniref:Uncharacterized protein n=1 Tax=Rhizophagus irregularis (strain DAOM 197198w) TaxID=1432141 RepID=A0A015IRQ4_RHIIW|nr:hypothetical protein RirG_184890 [Rhizophagus irregularis DAOM 197198w]UZO05212.1 hypothetical protein OCT59_025572 [Rhizophagus irregularis]GBC11299.1 hypothetical protein GLOIN_2v1834188 [Rhizophagus irregularis DAOM 181602=DAOM 197198]CAB4464141.1 unnamed protein product [Rhizophagus irregularis]
MWLNRSLLGFLFLTLFYLLPVVTGHCTTVTKTRHYTKTIRPTNCPKATTTTTTSITTTTSTTTTVTTSTVTVLPAIVKRTNNRVKCIPDKKVYQSSKCSKCKRCRNKHDKRCKKRYNECKKCKVTVYCTPTVTLPCQKPKTVTTTAFATSTAIATTTITSIFSTNTPTCKPVCALLDACNLDTFQTCCNLCCTSIGGVSKCCSSDGLGSQCPNAIHKRLKSSDSDRPYMIKEGKKTFL